ncbi:MAG: hypothetical protein ACOC4I_02635 [Spirochaetota bacterium]
MTFPTKPWEGPKAGVCTVYSSLTSVSLDYLNMCVTGSMKSLGLIDEAWGSHGYTYVQ